MASTSYAKHCDCHQCRTKKLQGLSSVLPGTKQTPDGKIWVSSCFLKKKKSIWANYNNSHAWNKAILGWFLLLTMIPVRSQWGRYNSPSSINLEAVEYQYRKISQNMVICWRLGGSKTGCFSDFDRFRLSRPKSGLHVIPGTSARVDPQVMLQLRQRVGREVPGWMISNRLTSNYCVRISPNIWEK